MSVQEYNVVTSFSFKYTLFNENKKNSKLFRQTIKFYCNI